MHLMFLLGGPFLQLKTGDYLVRRVNGRRAALSSITLYTENRLFGYTLRRLMLV